VRRNPLIFALLWALAGTSVLAAPTALAAHSAAEPIPPQGPAEWAVVRGSGTHSSVVHSLSFTANGRYVSAEMAYTGDNSAMLRARATAIGPWERYALFHNRRTGRYALFSKANLRFVSTELGYTGGSYAMLRARATAIGPSEQFFLS
jgi:hypothetical protein